MWVPISSTNTRRPESMRPISMRHRLLKNSTRSAAHPDLFLAPTQTSYRPTDRRSVNAETPGGLALWDPFFTDSTIFSLRSNEYAFMFLPTPAQHQRNPL